MHRMKLAKLLDSPSVDVSSLTEYSYINKMYVTMNTDLHTRAAIERLRSLVLTLFRSRLGFKGLYFEMVMFLRSKK